MPSNWLGCLLGLLLTHCLCSPGFGAANLVQNGSFENQTNAPWSDTGVSWFGGFNSAADGRSFVGVSDLIYQDLTTTPGQSYHLRFAMAGNPNWRSPITMSTLWDNNVVTETNWNPLPHNYNNLGWIYTDMDVVASSSLTRLEFFNPGAYSGMPFVDGVSVTLTPEPSGLLLLALGGLVVFKRWRVRARR